MDGSPLGWINSTRLASARGPTPLRPGRASTRIEGRFGVALVETSTVQAEPIDERIEFDIGSGSAPARLPRTRVPAQRTNRFHRSG